MAESMVEASGTIQAPNVMGIEIMTIRFARERPETAFSSGDAGLGLTNLLWIIIYSIATHSASDVPSNAPALPMVHPPRANPIEAKGSATATFPTCSIS